jgi:pSer/pThr/pTyr-binding forkhead associated (FHA) protein
MAGIFLREVAKETAIGFLYRDSESGKAKIWIRNDANLLIGRSPSCDIVLTDQHVSREHCVIHTSDNQAFVVPLQPTNAVLIDGEAISRKTLLPDGCRIKLGTIEFHFYHFQ